jgi:hypothetical protein
MIHIFATVCGRTEFIELQNRAFQKNLQEDFKFTIFNNCMWDRMAEYDGIKSTCQRLGLECIDIQKDPDLIRRCDAIEPLPTFNGRGNYTIVNVAAQYSDNWAWENVISKEPGAILLLHADVFMAQLVKLTSYLERYQLGYVPQARDGAGEYMHDALVLADIPKLPDVKSICWCGGQINGVSVDGGGQTFHYLTAHPELSTLRIGCHYHQDDPGLGFHPTDFEMFHLEDVPAFLHYRTGYNWNGRSTEYHEVKTEWLKRTLAL